MSRKFASMEENESIVHWFLRLAVSASSAVSLGHGSHLDNLR